MKTLTYKGFIEEKEHGESYDNIFLSGMDEPLACILQDEISCKNVTARYWISDSEKTKEEITDAFLRTVMGEPDICLIDRYSECTGYLWTDEDLIIGGHDILEELRSEKGKYVIIEFDLHDD